MLNLKKKKLKGFTLVEIIVVIAIIGVLAAVIGIAMMGYLKEARQSQASTDARNISVCTHRLLYSDYGGFAVKQALVDSGAESCAFIYTGGGTSDPAVKEILEEIGEEDYKNGFVIYIEKANTSSPEVSSVYVYASEPSYAASASKDIEPDGAFPAEELAKFGR
ncbi:MAG: prepilin-type N-terminal cleavage/methylation domain-containing protein [Oscillospiraceae bacterium]